MLSSRREKRISPDKDSRKKSPRVSLQSSHATLLFGVVQRWKNVPFIQPQLSTPSRLDTQKFGTDKPKEGEEGKKVTSPLVPHPSMHKWAVRWIRALSLSEAGGTTMCKKVWTSGGRGKVLSLPLFFLAGRKGKSFFFKGLNFSSKNVGEDFSDSGTWG